MRADAASRKEALDNSNEMAPVQGTVDVDVPITVLWEAFAHANWWPRWNKCFFWAHNRDLIEGQRLVWAFQPIRWYYLYKMFAIANIVEVEKEKKVTWEVTAMPGFYARHTYHMEDLGGGRSRFGSWEQAMGSQIRAGLTRRFWIAHFTFVKDRSLEGAKMLESIYRHDGRISEAALHGRTNWARGLALLLLFFLLLIGSSVAWFYESYVRLTAVEILPGVTAVLDGGGNSTLVRDGDQLLLIDTKFPPGSTLLRRWISKHVDIPVSMIVNTHYHYDHTQGNTQYPRAVIYAYQNVPDLMRKRDGAWWSQHQAAMPTKLVGDEATIRVGSQPVLLVHPGPAHTQGDLYAVIHRDDKDVVATGDIVFNTYYPMMDLGDGGMDLHGLRAAVQGLVDKYPNAIFIPGHGPIANSEDLRRYAAYLKSLTDSIDSAQHDGVTEDEAVARIDLSSWHLRKLPTFHDNHLCWSNAAMNIHWAYQLEAGTRIQRLNCTF